MFSCLNNSMQSLGRTTNVYNNNDTLAICARRKPAIAPTADGKSCSHVIETSSLGLSLVAIERRRAIGTEDSGTLAVHVSSKYSEYRDTQSELQRVSKICRRSCTVVALIGSQRVLTHRALVTNEPPARCLMVAGHMRRHL